MATLGKLFVELAVGGQKNSAVQHLVHRDAVHARGPHGHALLVVGILRVGHDACVARNR